MPSQKGTFVFSQKKHRDPLATKRSESISVSACWKGWAPHSVTHGDHTESVKR